MQSKYKGIDEREIKCCSENPNSIESGISFDTYEDGTNFLRFHYLELINGTILDQRTKSMKLNKENVKQLIDALKSLKIDK